MFSNARKAPESEASSACTPAISYVIEFYRFVFFFEVNEIQILEYPNRNLVEHVYMADSLYLPKCGRRYSRERTLLNCSVTRRTTDWSGPDEVRNGACRKRGGVATFDLISLKVLRYGALQLR